MQIPSDRLELVSTTYQAMKGLTLEVITHCHNPDYETMIEQVRSYFSKLEEEAFQLSLFEEPSALK